MGKLRINCDGGARGNPGPAAAAFVVRDDNNNIVYKGSKYLGESSNNFAEYSAILLAFEWLIEKANKENVEILNFFLDSELAVKQLNGIYKVKDEKLRVLFMAIKEYIKKLTIPVTFSHVTRDKNQFADILVNNTLDSVKSST